MEIADLWGMMLLSLSFVLLIFIYEKLIFIRKYIYFDFEEYGDGTYLFDRDFSELPKYIKKKCADLLAFELSIDRTIDHLTHGDNQ